MPFKRRRGHAVTRLLDLESTHRKGVKPESGDNQMDRFAGSTGFVIFSDFGRNRLDFRIGGAALPTGSIPLYAEANHVGVFLDTASESALQGIILEARFSTACSGKTVLQAADFVAIAQSDWANDALDSAVGLRRKEWVTALHEAGYDFDLPKIFREIEDAQFEEEYDRGMREYLHGHF